MVAVCYITRRLELFAITYVIMLLHEFAHLCTALAIGLKPGYIALHPFGVNLRLKNKIICSLSDEIILYSAGPLLNILLALTSVLLFRYYPSDYLYDFYLKNIFLFCTNILPIVPMDGGIILKKLIMYKKGAKTAKRVMTIISAVFISGVMAVGIYMILLNNMNFSVILLSVFMIGNIFTQKEKYNVDFINEIIFYKNKKRKNVKIYAVNKKESLESIALDFDMQNFYIIFLLNDSGGIDDVLTETQILDAVTIGKENKYKCIKVR